MCVMARRTMKEILADRRVDVAVEFRRLWKMFTTKVTDAFGASAYGAVMSCSGITSHDSILDVCNNYFSEFPVEIRHTLRSVDELESACGFSFQGICYGERDIDLSDLMDLMEFVWTLLRGLMAVANQRFPLMRGAVAYLHDHMVSQMTLLLEEIGCMCVDGSDYVVSIAPKDARVIEVSKRVPRDLSVRAFEYIHRSMEGELEEKRGVLREFGQYLEPKKDELRALNSEVCNRLFSMLNNANIRHNNIAKGDKSYREVIARMSEASLEQIYDDTYELCLTACMLLDSRAAIARVKAVEAQFGT